MAFKLGSLIWSIKADTKDFDKGAKSTETEAKSLGKSFTTLGKTIAAGFAVVAVAGITSVSKELISAASAAEETSNKFNVVFGTVADDAEAAAARIQDEFKLSDQTTQNFLSQVGDITSGLGATSTEALNAAEQITSLGLDIDSFANLSGGAEQAVSALTSLFTGEREAAKALGIVINDTNLKQYAEDTGKIFKELTPLEKGFLSLELATTQSTLAIGDFARSEDSFANQSRIAKAAVEDLTAGLGRGLLPVATEVVGAFGDITRAFADYITEAEKVAAANENLRLSSQGTGDAIAAYEEQKRRIEEVKAAINGERGALRKLAEEYGFNTRKVEQWITEQENDLKVKKASAERAQQRIDDLQAEADALDEAAEAAERKAEAEKKEQDELQAYLDFINGEYATTQQGKIDALAEEIALLELYAETAIETGDKIATILEDRYAQMEALTEVEEEYNKVALSGAEERANAWREELRLADMTIAAIDARTARQQQYANDIIASTQFWTSQSQAIVDSLYTYELAALQQKLDNSEISEEEFAKKKSKILKEQAIAQKVASLFSIGIETAANVVEVFPNPYLMAAAGVLGAVQAGLVAATPIPAFADGGIVPGNSFSGDNVLTRQNSGELNINRADQQTLFKAIKGGNFGGSGVQKINVYIGTKKIASEMVSSINSGVGGTINARVVK